MSNPIPAPSVVSRTRFSGIVGLLGLLLVAAAPSHAQHSHSVAIKDGIVRVDGKPIPQSELPPSLNVDGVTAHMQFSGGTRFEFGGLLYGIDAGRIVEIPDREGAPIVLFFDGVDGRRYRVPAPMDHTDASGDYDRAFGAFGDALGARALELEKLGDELTSRERDHDDLIRQMRDEAQTAAFMVRSFPRVEMQSYLDGLQQRDQALYERMMREQRMEVESRQLAARIRTASSDSERSDIEEELKERLSEMFELKQQNRREEIEQLDGQLRELREQLQARERNRRAIIERRLKQLIDGEPR